VNAPPARDVRPVRRIVVVWLVAVAAVAAAAAARRYVVPPAPPGMPGGEMTQASVGRPAPAFALPLLNGGGTLALASLRGRPVLLNFWASWCAPCREETPLLVRVHRRYAGRVHFVGVDAEDRPEDARRFARRYHVDYPLVRMEDDRLVDAYGLPGLPTTVFIDARGRIVARTVGGFVGAEGERLLVERLERLLHGPAP
jgi:cytochrome c biogenesis protein CcmG/thiol:disulfide interchange protein DsbE